MNPINILIIILFVILTCSIFGKDYFKNLLLTSKKKELDKDSYEYKSIPEITEKPSIRFINEYKYIFKIPLESIEY